MMFGIAVGGDPCGRPVGGAGASPAPTRTMGHDWIVFPPRTIALAEPTAGRTAAVPGEVAPHPPPAVGHAEDTSAKGSAVPCRGVLEPRDDRVAGWAMSNTHSPVPWSATRAYVPEIPRRGPVRAVVPSHPTGLAGSATSTTYSASPPAGRRHRGRRGPNRMRGRRCPGPHFHRVARVGHVHNARPPSLSARKAWVPETTTALAWPGVS